MQSLKDHTPFANGGNRNCFVDPGAPDRCIKVRRPQFTLQDLRKKKGFPYTFLPLSYIDESVKEYAIMQRIDARIGESAYSILPRNFGFVETDLGVGLCSELIRNADGKICRSVMQYVWEQGVDSELERAVDRFEAEWLKLLIPTRDLLLHNMVVQLDQDGGIQRLVLIDGLGHSGLIPFSLLPERYKVIRAKRKMLKFRELLADLNEVRKTGKLPSSFWLLKHDGTSSE